MMDRNATGTRRDDHRDGRAAPNPSSALPEPAGPAPGGRPDRRRGPGGGDDTGRRRRSGDRRAGSGFSDGVERAFCERMEAVAPPDFPVQGRPGLASLRILVVDLHRDAVLFCDSGHHGDHRWPNGEPIGQIDPDPDAP